MRPNTRESTPNKPSSGDLTLPPKDNTQPCLREACQIQTCLQNNNFQESRCQKVINELFNCCEELLKSGGESPSCSSLLNEMIIQDFLFVKYSNRQIAQERGDPRISKSLYLEKLKKKHLYNGILIV
ncbi:cx9C motif-containing protein 4 [Rhizophagus irregularis DAOM 181602=DAOM 197198]|nr:cx9C motif-containing protein 4 [Rhizophagus irregularis DAOM 181602=DAOM 197198]CAB4480929.1 unnamed protein product [Rhizophagus irregularis]CAB5198861.1 unnamed protein product [Rhizophagus irregularis]